MPKYLIEASYSAEGLKGLHKDKASGRRAAVAKAVESLGGKLDLYYFCLGEHDVVGVNDMPTRSPRRRFPWRFPRPACRAQRPPSCSPWRKSTGRCKRTSPIALRVSKLSVRGRT